MKGLNRGARVLADVLCASLLLLSAPVLATAATTPAKTTKAANAKVLVRIGGEAITQADVEKRLAELPEQSRGQFDSPEGRRQLLDRLIEERIWLIAAKKKGVEARPEVQTQLQAQRRDLVIRTYLGEVMAENPAPSDSEAHLYYDEHLSDYKVPATVTVRHIQSKTEAESRNVLKLLRSGQDWDKAALKYSADTLSRAHGGLLAAVTHDGLFAGLGRQSALAESAFALGTGKLGGPYKSDKGWHLIKVDELKPETARPFETLRPTIVRQMSGQRTQEFYKQRLERERKRLGVTPDSTAIRNFISKKQDVHDLFKAAQTIGPAAERVVAYQKLLDQYPNSDVSAQSQFMIGFIHSEELKNYDEAEKAFRLVLTRYPRSELATSARWMVEHMRTEDAPAFLPMEADSSAPAHATPRAGKSTSVKP
jgi:peptidyl-prolyl cis-trans isomerase C